MRCLQHRNNVIHKDLLFFYITVDSLLPSIYMANKLKSKTAPFPPDPAQLKPDKEEQVTVKEVVKDERTTKIFGAVNLLLCAFLFICCTSYIFTWQEDQDKVLQFGVKIFSTTDVRVSNLLGVLGAYTSHNLIYNGFGLAAYLLCTFFFVLGVNLLFGKKFFKLARNLKYMLVGLLVISVTLAFFTSGSAFSYGGALGELVNDWFVKWIGKAGTGAILSLAAFSYFIWRFNPTFKIPERKKAASVIATEPLTAAADSFTQNQKETMQPAAALFVAEEATPNSLKKNGSSVTVVMPKKEAEPNPMTEFGLIEKDEIPEPATVELLDENIEEELEEEPEIEAAFVTGKKKEDLPLEIKQPLPTLNDLYTKKEVKPELEVEELPTFYKPVKPVASDFALEIKPIVTEPFEVPEKLDIADDEDAEIPLPQIKGDYEPTLDLSDYQYPGLELLETHGSEKIVHDAEELEANKTQIIETLKNYDIAIQRIAATVGPTVTLYEIVPAPGVRISRIKNLEDDIALSLAALGIRIIAPIPGKGTIGIEVPNVRKTVVSMKTLLASEKFQSNTFSLPIAIGKKIDNENFIVDLAAMPHLLMAGATGQGKSVGINTLLVSLLYKKHPSQLKFVLVDPKKVELSLYRVIEKHFLAKLPGEEESIITDTKKVIHTLNALCIEMDNRYDLLKEAGCRNIKEYNEKFVKRRLNPLKGHQFLPFIVLVVDEFADLIMTAGKEVEMPIARLAQLARAVGIHLIIATQRPSVNIITGTIKANFPARIAFKVSSKIDSRTILDAGGAEQLIGKGDMLISYNGEITRLQCAFVDTPEVERIAEFIGYQANFPEQYYLPEFEDEKELAGKDFDAGDRDPLFEDAAKLIVANQIGSTSLIQRKMKLGYNRAGRLMDQLEQAGIVGKNAGSKAREVLVKSDGELFEILGQTI